VEFRGGSGTAYSFTRLEQGALRSVGVTYVIASEGADGWRLLGVGHTNNLVERDWSTQLEVIRRRDPGACVLVRLNVNRSIREAEAADLASLIETGGVLPSCP
jgi:hypothetical protein